MTGYRTATKTNYAFAWGIFYNHLTADPDIRVYQLNKEDLGELFINYLIWMKEKDENNELVNIKKSEFHLCSSAVSSFLQLIFKDSQNAFVNKITRQVSRGYNLEYVKVERYQELWDANIAMKYWNNKVFDIDKIPQEDKVKESFLFYRNKTIFLFAFFSLLRPSELANLRISKDFRLSTKDGDFFTLEIKSFSGWKRKVFVPRLENKKLCPLENLEKLIIVTRQYQMILQTEEELFGKKNGIINTNLDFAFLKDNCRDKLNCRLISISIKRELENMGIDVSKYTAYSMKHAVVSFLTKLHVPADLLDTLVHYKMKNKTIITHYAHFEASKQLYKLLAGEVDKIDWNVYGLSERTKENKEIGKVNLEEMISPPPYNTVELISINDEVPENNELYKINKVEEILMKKGQSRENLQKPSEELQETEKKFEINKRITKIFGHKVNSNKRVENGKIQLKLYKEKKERKRKTAEKLLKLKIQKNLIPETGKKRKVKRIKEKKEEDKIKKVIINEKDSDDSIFEKESEEKIINNKKKVRVKSTTLKAKSFRKQMIIPKNKSESVKIVKRYELDKKVKVNNPKENEIEKEIEVTEIIHILPTIVPEDADYPANLWDNE
jgi:hypothetical protein